MTPVVMSLTSGSLVVTQLGYKAAAQHAHVPRHSVATSVFTAGSHVHPTLIWSAGQPPPMACPVSSHVFLRVSMQIRTLSSLRECVYVNASQLTDSVHSCAHSALLCTRLVVRRVS